MKNTLSIFAALFMLILGVNAQSFQHVDAKTFADLIASQQGIVLDVRTAGEYSRGHIEGSTLISTSDQKFVEKVKLLQKNKPIYVYCLTGSRSNAVANYLSQKGYGQVYNLQRGILEWQRMGYATVQSAAVSASASKEYSPADFTKLINSSNLVLVDFHAPWCAPCKKMAPDIAKIKKAYAGKAGVEKVDIEVNKALQSTYQVQSIPGLILFKQGKEIWRHTGVLTYPELEETLKRYL